MIHLKRVNDLFYHSHNGDVVFKTGKANDLEFLRQFYYEEKGQETDFSIVPVYMRFLLKWKDNYQKEIKDFFSTIDGNKVFVFQRGDYIPVLPFLNDFLVVKHSCPKESNAYAIPYHLSNVKELKSIEDAKYEVSFTGSDYSHSLRLLIPTLLAPFKEKAYLKNTEFFFKIQDQIQKKEMIKTYNESLNDSVFVLCPPGLALNSIRFFETIKLGRIPILFEDKCKLPFDWIIPYEDLILRIDAQKNNLEEEIEKYRQTHNIIEVSNELKNINFKYLRWNPKFYLETIVDFLA